MIGLEQDKFKTTGKRNPDKECPFCGGKPSVRNWSDNERNGYCEHWQVRCSQCSASSPSSSYMPYGVWIGGGKPNIKQDRDAQEQEAHDNWNRRYYPGVSPKVETKEKRHVQS